MTDRQKKAVLAVVVIALALCHVAEAGFWGPWSPVTVVNTSYEEGSPWVSQDGLTMYFHSNQLYTGGGGGVDYSIWTSTRTAGVWGAPQRVGELSQTGVVDASPYVTPDNQTVYFATTRDGTYDLYTSTWGGTAWGAPVALAGDVNTSTYREAGPCRGRDDSTLYYWVQTTSSQYVRDLAYATWDAGTSSWQAQGSGLFVNVNTTANAEYNPRVSLDGTLMYFVRTPPGGNADLYRSEWDAGLGVWGTATALPVGSSVSQHGVHFWGERGELYFDSQEHGWDIYSSQWVPEPCSLVLLGAGLLALHRRRKR